MPQFRAGLRNVVGATDHVAARLPRRWPDRCRGQAATAFGGVRPARLANLRDQTIQRWLKTLGNLFEVIPLDAVVAGIVFGRDEPGVIANAQTAPGQAGAHRRPVGQGGETRAFGPPWRPEQAPQS